ncbi:hypothetical protein IAI10_20055 [Clostridium sp. 19966]|uniref:LuxR C-terminal-related transcriptional regulator n=1 Tax=Clostridium sp. 19966 TaxID=2768166 RepID=UPI0028DF9E49|nr:LuxR C-terminal-related transcriptional regulator [Clostridium sp. 19966]MDT8718950.1 hypothetical protein [Clostridium sp. 19966]
MKENMLLIATKLKMPLPRKNYIKRERLINQLAAIEDYKITIIKGAAASGKTTLITGFFKEKANDNVCFIALDKTNDNLFSFWYYFFVAVKGYLGEEGEAILNSFDSLLGKSEINNMLVMLINMLANREDIIVLLDDFHYVEDEALVESLNFFIKYMPENVHLVMTTREEPRIAISDYMVKGDVLQIDEEELKFSKVEMQEFLRRTLNVNYSEDIIVSMEKICEGWVGGLQLVALASSNNNKVIDSLKILNKYVVEYLSQQILGALSEKYKEFLVKTSVFSYFNKDMCNELLGIEDSKEIIEELINKNLFVINIGEDSENYRYHAMLREFLQLELSKGSVEEIKGLKSRASDIYAYRNDVEEALNQLIAIEEYAKAMNLILAKGQTPKGWVYLNKIPDYIIIQNNEASFQKIFYNFSNLKFEDCRKFVNFTKNNSKDLALKKIMNYVELLVDDSFDIVSCDETIDIEEIDALNFSGVTKMIIYLRAALYLALYDKYRDVLQLIDKALEIEKNQNNAYVRFFSLTMKATTMETMDSFEACMEIYKEIFDMLRQYKFLGYLNINVYVGITGIYLKSMQLDKAQESLDLALKNLDALDKTNEKNDTMYRGYLYNVIELKILQGNKEEALRIYKNLERFPAYKNPIYKASILSFLFSLKEFESNDFLDFLEYYCNEKNKNKLRIEDRRLYAKIQFFVGNIEEAMLVNNKALMSSRQEGVVIEVIYCILFKLRMLNLNYEKNKKEIMALTKEAIYYGCKNRMFAPFVYEKEQLKGFLHKAAKELKNNLENNEWEFLKNVREFIGEGEEKAKDDILSPREIEVLMELAKGATNKEIGDALCISVATVKTHIINIYSKLNAKNRIEAVQIAQVRGFKIK